MVGGEGWAHCGCRDKVEMIMMMMMMMVMMMMTMMILYYEYSSILPHQRCRSTSSEMMIFLVVLFRLFDTDEIFGERY